MLKKYLPFLALALVSFIWGTTWVVVKMGVLTGIHPLYLAGLRLSIAGFCYLLFFFAAGKAVWPGKKDWTGILFMSALLFIFSNGFATWGTRYISSGLAAIIAALFPLFVAIIQMFGPGGKRPGNISLAGLLIGFAGVIIIFYEQLIHAGNRNFLTGILLSLTAATSWAFAVIFTTKASVKLNRYYLLGWQMFLGGLFLVLVSGITGNALSLTSIPAKTWLLLVYLVLPGSIIAFIAFIYALQHLPTALVSIYAYINPMVALFFGHVLLNEQWNFSLLTGSVVTLVGVYMVNEGVRKRNNGNS